MKHSLSVIILTKNSSDTIENCLVSIKNFCDEIIVIDDNSTDKTKDLIKMYPVKFYQRHDDNLSSQRLFGINKSHGDWIFILDSDEVVPLKLAMEIKRVLYKKYDSYYIKYENHFLGKRISHGGENYKVLRLFKKGKVSAVSSLLHEKFLPSNNNFSTLKCKIYHYSYRSILQTIKKFTNYAQRNAKEKARNGEKSSFEKIFFYPIHMFWARFIKDEGYRDGFFRIPLDLSFAYMEFLTYVYLLFQGQ